MRREEFRDKVRTAVVLCAAAAFAVVVPASASTGAPAPAQVVAVDCFSEAQTRPTDFLLACGDGNNRLTQLEWSSWGPTAAVAKGLDVVNDCEPYCAAGTFRSYAVTVRLDRPEAWEAQPELERFTQLRLTYTDDRPPRVPREVTYELWD
ncbi:hypothetical protein [Streptomyces sp. SP18CS02]|uniref:hypothetical protein n=1 Tax=Streptomyces sp. SP18CS02 TaxID=3002531 RepID=UPI002E7968D3|nr:hypothetical protein [Streptomyces sp. SP18CS02]MEE1752025.1 hypothetical protein [Streptomyces sp. SP18CS02]